MGFNCQQLQPVPYHLGNGTEAIVCSQLAENTPHSQVQIVLSYKTYAEVKKLYNKYDKAHLYVSLCCTNVHALWIWIKAERWKWLMNTEVDDWIDTQPNDSYSHELINSTNTNNPEFLLPLRDECISSPKNPHKDKNECAKQCYNIVWTPAGPQLWCWAYNVCNRQQNIPI